jgi:hypothetical protein
MTFAYFFEIFNDLRGLEHAFYMDLIAEWIRYASENSLISALLAACVIFIVRKAVVHYQDVRDTNLICEYLAESASMTGYVFRSTHAISACTRISESRVVELCIKHPKIKRNEKEKQSWQLLAQ